MARKIAKDHDKKRLHILRTAAEVFAGDGVARASMSRVAQACGISKANIYHYYSGKDALLFDILDTYLSALRDRICKLPLDGVVPADKLRLITKETLLAYDGMDAEHQIQTEGIPLLPLDQQEILKGYQRDMVQQLSTVLAEISPGKFEHDRQKLRATTMSVFGMLNWFYMWHQGADRQAREAYARLISDLTLKGVAGV